MNDGKKSSRRRRSSSLLYQEPPESMEHMSDQSALPNLNANWVNAKGMLAAESRETRKRIGPFIKDQTTHDRVACLIVSDQVRFGFSRKSWSRC